MLVLGIIYDKLVLADWDDLRWAPVEADLFIYTWHNKFKDVFLNAYCNKRNGYFINRELLNFYRLRRHIEDMWVDIERITEESPGDKIISELMGWIPESIGCIQVLYNEWNI